MPKSGHDVGNPAIDRDVRSMERKKRVTEVLQEDSFRSELEDMVVAQKDGNKPMFHSGIKMSGSTEFKGMGNTRQVNDLTGAMRDRYSKTERGLRCKLAALYRLTAQFEWDHLIYSHITAKLPGEEEHFLINPYGMQYSEITASSLIKIDIEGNIVDPGSTVLPVNKAGFKLNSALHKAEQNVVYHTHSHAGTAISAMKCGLLNLCQEALIVRPVSYGSYQGFVPTQKEQDQLEEDLIDGSNAMILVNHGLVSVGKTVEEAFLYMCQLTKACEIQWRVLRHGDVTRLMDEATAEEFEGTLPVELTCNPNGREYGPGELEFESYMRKMDRDGQNTGYPYKTPTLFRDQLPTYHSVQYPPIVPGMDGPPSDQERAKLPSKSQRSAWFKNNSSPEQQFSPPPVDEWKKGKKGDGPKKLTPFESVLKSDPKHSLSSGDYKPHRPYKLDSGCKSPRMRDIERELERLQKQYKGKPRKPTPPPPDSEGTAISDPSTDGRRSDEPRVESLSDSSDHSIEMAVADVPDNEKMPTVEVESVDEVEDMPQVQMESMDEVEDMPYIELDTVDPVNKSDPTKSYDVIKTPESSDLSESDFSEDVLQGVQDDLLEIEQLVVNTDDAFTGMSDDSDDQPATPTTGAAPMMSEESVSDPELQAAFAGKPNLKHQLSPSPTRRIAPQMASDLSSGDTESESPELPEFAGKPNLKHQQSPASAKRVPPQVVEGLVSDSTDSDPQITTEFAGKPNLKHSISPNLFRKGVSPQVAESISDTDSDSRDFETPRSDSVADRPSDDEPVVSVDAGDVAGVSQHQPLDLQRPEEKDPALSDDDDEDDSPPDTTKDIDIRMGEDGVEVHDEITCRSITTSILEIVETQEDEFQVITISPGQLTEDQKEELRKEGYILQEA